MHDAFAPNTRNAGAVVAVVVLLVLAYVVVPRPVVQYGAWLVIFSIWMAWFVAAGVQYVYEE
jgi:hypothetical protein